MSSTKEIYAKLTYRFLGALKAGVSPWEKASIKTNQPKNHKSQVPYKGFNRLMLSLMGYEVAEYLTFNQAREKKMPVKKGEKGTTLMKYMIMYADKDSKKTITEEKYEALDPSKKADYKKVPLVQTFTVFNLAQCEDSYSKLNEIKKGYLTNEKKFEFEVLLRGYLNLEEIDINEGKEAVGFGDKSISIPSRWQCENVEQYYIGLASAAVNTTSSKDRLDWEGSAAYRELVGGIGAAFLCDLAGVNTNEIFKHSNKHKTEWIEEISKNAKYLIDAAKHAEAAVSYITHRIDIRVAANLLAEQGSIEQAA